MCAPSLAHLVLAPAPDVAAEGELLLVELVAGEHVVELVHRKVDDLAQRERDPDLAGLALVTRLTDPAEYRICMLVRIIGEFPNTRLLVVCFSTSFIL